VAGARAAGGDGVMLPDERMVEAATRHLQLEWAGPYLARISDFTHDEVIAGRLKEADEEAEREAEAEARKALTAAFAALDRDALIELGAQEAPADRVACRRWHERGECRNCDKRRWIAERVLRAVGLIS
jgi:hypothetical protein